MALLGLLVTTILSTEKENELSRIWLNKHTPIVAIVTGISSVLIATGVISIFAVPILQSLSVDQNTFANLVAPAIVFLAGATSGFVSYLWQAKRLEKLEDDEQSQQPRH